MVAGCVQSYSGRCACLHLFSRSLGLLSDMPAEQLAEVEPPHTREDFEAGWCPACGRYVYRHIGGIDWSACSRHSGVNSWSAELVSASQTETASE